MSSSTAHQPNERPHLLQRLSRKVLHDNATGRATRRAATVDPKHPSSPIPSAISSPTLSWLRVSQIPPTSDENSDTTQIGANSLSHTVFRENIMRRIVRKTAPLFPRAHDSPGSKTLTTGLPLPPPMCRVVRKLPPENNNPSTPPRRQTPRRAATAACVPLTASEGRAINQVLHEPSPQFVLSDERQTPRAEIDHVSHQIGRANMYRRGTFHVVRELGPETPDERILRTFRRKSYTEASQQFHHDSTPLW